MFWKIYCNEICVTVSLYKTYECYFAINNVLKFQLFAFDDNVTEHLRKTAKAVFNDYKYHSEALLVCLWHFNNISHNHYVFFKIFFANQVLLWLEFVMLLKRLFSWNVCYCYSLQKLTKLWMLFCYEIPCWVFSSLPLMITLLSI